MDRGRRPKAEELVRIQPGPPLPKRAGFIQGRNTRRSGLSPPQTNEHEEEGHPGSSTPVGEAPAPRLGSDLLEEASESREASCGQGVEGGASKRLTVWPSGEARDCKSRHPGSNPGAVSRGREGRFNSWENCGRPCFKGGTITQSAAHRRPAPFHGRGARPPDSTSRPTACPAAHSRRP
jgi:hypothetical protein